MQCYKVNIDTKKIKRTKTDPNPQGNSFFNLHRTKQYNYKIDYKGILYNFFANCPSFYSTSFIVNSIIKDGIKYPVGLYIDDGDKKIICHPGMRRLLCLEFLGIYNIDGIIIEKNLNFNIFNKMEKIDLPDINFWKNLKGKYEYIPQDVLDKKSRYPDFILSNFQTQYGDMFDSIKSINIFTDYSYEVETLYFPESYSLNWQKVYNNKRKININFYPIDYSNSNYSDICLYIKKKLKINPLELLYFLHPDYYCHQDKKSDIIIYNNISSSNNTLNIPESYIKKACYET